MIPQTHYAMVGELGIAFQVIGEGPPDLMWSAGSVNHVDEIWEDPSAAVFLRRVAGFSRLVRFDVLGAGASDRLAPGVDPPAFSDQLDGYAPPRRLKGSPFLPLPISGQVLSSTRWPTLTG